MYKAMKAAALLAVVLMTAMCATTVLTDGTDAATAWDGTSDTGWYNESDSTFEISTAEQLAGLAEKVNEGVDFSGKTITLTADIDLGGKEWTPIGDGSRLSSISTGNSFDGKFIGGDHTITGLTISSTTNANIWGTNYARSSSSTTSVNS